MNPNEIKQDPRKDEVEKTLVKETSVNSKPRMRQVIIETDGNGVRVVKAEVSGNLELSAICQAILNNLSR
jgi:hypothetical protein